MARLPRAGGRIGGLAGLEQTRRGCNNRLIILGPRVIVLRIIWAQIVVIPGSVVGMCNSLAIGTYRSVQHVGSCAWVESRVLQAKHRSPIHGNRRVAIFGGRGCRGGAYGFDGGMIRQELCNRHVQQRRDTFQSFIVGVR